MKKNRVDIQKWSAAASVKAPRSPGWRGRLCCIVLAVLVAAANLCPPALAISASVSCSVGHSYAKYFNSVHNEELDTDYCVNCGHIRIHECRYDLRFMTVGKTYLYTEPRTSSASRLLTNSARINVNVTGRARNENGEMWLLLDNGSYIPADSAAFNFEYYAKKAVDKVSGAIDRIVGMGITYHPGGDYDMKRDELLGNTYFYKVYLAGKILPEQYTGEQIGNMLYGYGGAAKGFSFDETVGWGVWATEKEDSLEDKLSILLGYTYRKNGAWYREVSSQYAGKTVAIKSLEVGQYVSSNTDQDIAGINAAANRDSVGTWELFTIEMGGAGAIGFRSKGNGNYLSARVDEKKESAYIQAAYGQNYTEPQSWESFYILDFGGDQYILSQANWRWVQVSRDEWDNPIKACADAPSTWERFQLETVNDSGAAGSGAAEGSTGSSTGGNTSGGNASSGSATGGNSSAPTTVSQYFWKSSYNEGWYEGDWSNGEPNGQGKLTYAGFEDGDYYSIESDGMKYKATCYEGGFRDGWRYGAGKVTYEGGWIQEGTFYGRWTPGQKCFEGRLWHKDGVRYLDGYQTVNSNGEEAGWTWQTDTWQSAAKIYQVSYHANGGSGSPQAQEKTQGVSLTLSSAAPTREGYTFLGWAENGAATGAEYRPGGSFAKDRNTTLYAVWKKIDRSATVIGAYLGKETTGAYAGKEVLFTEYKIVGYATGEAWLTFEDVETGERVYWYGPVASQTRTSLNPEYILQPGKTYQIYFSGDNGTGSRIGESYTIFTYPKPAGESGLNEGAFLYSTPSEWAREEISQAYQMGWMPDYMAMNYLLAATRLDFVRLAYDVIEHQCGPMEKILYERGMVEHPYAAPALTFGDIPDNSGYDGRDGYRVAALNALGIVNGVGDNRFEPYRAITREEAAALLSRVYSFIRWGEVGHYAYDNSLELYDDNDKISNWAFYDVYHMKSIQVMNGVGNNLFAPKDYYSREQSIVTFVRLLNCSNH